VRGATVLRDALALLSVSVLLAAAPATRSAGSCVSSKLSRAEAQQLVLRAPDVLAIQQAGGKVDALEWRGSAAAARPDLFYYFELQRPKLETLPLQSGLVGHFAVNRYSARVLNLDTGAAVAGAELAKLQAQLRSKHCISEQLVQENEEIEP